MRSLIGSTGGIEAEMTAKRYPWFTKGDLDGFFGLAVDNLVQVLVIAALCKELCGFTDALLFTRVFPAIAISLLVGNLYYALHARRVARRDHNPTCTALPYGINTISVFAYILFIMAPVYQGALAKMPATMDAAAAKAAAGDLAWKVGLAACIGSGLIEFFGSFIGGWVRRVTPRAALLSALAAIGVIFIASPFAFQIFERPLVAMVPLFVVLIGYFAKVKFPYGMPSGLVAVILGTVLAWTVPLLLGPTMMSFRAVANSFSEIGLHKPVWCWNEIVDLMRDNPTLVWSFMGVIVPMGLINAIGSLQNIESADAAGDRFSTGPCMAVNGIGTIAAGLFGSCFPTTIYIGHPGWKALGARCGYSILNGVFFTVAFTLGLGALFVSVIPMEAGMAIVLWIGIVIAAQCYEVVPKEHYPAVAIGFFPAVAVMAILFVPQILQGVGATNGILPMLIVHGDALETVRTDSWWPVGVYALAGANSGFVITCVIFSAISATLIMRKFKEAAIWCLVGAAMTLAGFQHAYRVEPGRYSLSPQELLIWQRNEDWFKGTSLYLAAPETTFYHRGYRIAAGYLLAAGMMLGIHRARSRWKGFEDIEVDVHGGEAAAGLIAGTAASAANTVEEAIQRERDRAARRRSAPVSRGKTSRELERAGGPVENPFASPMVGTSAAVAADVEAVAPSDPVATEQMQQPAQPVESEKDWSSESWPVESTQSVEEVERPRETEAERRDAMPATAPESGRLPSSPPAKWPFVDDEWAPGGPHGHDTPTAPDATWPESGAEQNPAESPGYDDAKPDQPPPPFDDWAGEGGHPR